MPRAGWAKPAEAGAVLAALVAGAALGQEPPAWPEVPTGVTWQLLSYGWDVAGRDPVEEYELAHIDFDDVAKIESAREAGKMVVCYLSAGTTEPFRGDVMGHLEDWENVTLAKMTDWNENWLNVTMLDDVTARLAPRFAIAKERGCHALEPDNVDCYANEECLGALLPQFSFEEVVEAQVALNKWIAAEAHRNGLAVGLKNALLLVDRLVDDFDFSVSEQCQDYTECHLLFPFRDQNKAILNLEYEVGPGIVRCEIAQYIGMSTKYCDGNNTLGVCLHGAWVDCHNPKSQRPTTRPSASPQAAAPIPDVPPPPNGPTLTDAPSKSPTLRPSQSPTRRTVTRSPSTAPTLKPTLRPTMSPSQRPTKRPSKAPTDAPTGVPSAAPSTAPTGSQPFKALDPVPLILAFGKEDEFGYHGTGPKWRQELLLELDNPLYQTTDAGPYEYARQVFKDRGRISWNLWPDDGVVDMRLEYFDFSSGWLGVGISETGSMVNAHAVIGMLQRDNPGYNIVDEYDITTQDKVGIVPSVQRGDVEYTSFAASRRKVVLRFSASRIGGSLLVRPKKVATTSPTATPTRVTSAAPSTRPTVAPTGRPSASPIPAPTHAPSHAPTRSPLGQLEPIGMVVAVGPLFAGDLTYHGYGDEFRQAVLVPVGSEDGAAEDPVAAAKGFNASMPVLGGNGLLMWRLLPETREVAYLLEYTKLDGFLALGLSPNQEMVGSSVAAGRLGVNGTVHIDEFRLEDKRGATPSTEPSVLRNAVFEVEPSSKVMRLSFTASMIAGTPVLPGPFTPGVEPTVAPTGAPQASGAPKVQPLTMCLAHGLTSGFTYHGAKREVFELHFGDAEAGSMELLGGAATLRWALSTGARALTFTVEIPGVSDGWVALGVSPGAMINSTVVGGSPEYGLDQYLLEGKARNMIKRLADGDRRLLESSGLEGESIGANADGNLQLEFTATHIGGKPLVVMSPGAPTSAPVTAPSAPSPGPGLAEPVLPVGALTWANLAWGATQARSDPVSGAHVILMDLDDLSNTENIPALRHAGHVVLCSFSAGGFEDWRPETSADKSQWRSILLPAGVSRTAGGHPWVDLGYSNTLLKLLAGRMDRAKATGCQGIDPGDLNCVENPGCAEAARTALISSPGYTHSQDGGDLAQELQLMQVSLNRNVARLAAERGLLVALRDVASLAGELHADFDLAVAVSCRASQQCDFFAPFTTAGKAVLNAEFGAASCDQVPANANITSKICVAGPTDTKECTGEWHNCFEPAEIKGLPTSAPTRPPGAGAGAGEQDGDELVPPDPEEVFMSMSILLGYLGALLLLSLVGRYQLGPIDLAESSKPKPDGSKDDDPYDDESTVVERLRQSVRSLSQLRFSDTLSNGWRGSAGSAAPGARSPGLPSGPRPLSDSYDGGPRPVPNARASRSRASALRSSMARLAAGRPRMDSATQRGSPEADM